MWWAVEWVGKSESGITICIGDREATQAVQWYRQQGCVVAAWMM